MMLGPGLAGEAEEGHAGAEGKVDGERRGGADGDEGGDAGHEGLLDKFEAGPAGDDQDGLGKGELPVEHGPVSRQEPRPPERPSLRGCVRRS